MGSPLNLDHLLMCLLLMLITLMSSSTINVSVCDICRLLTSSLLQLISDQISLTKNDW